MNLDTQEEYQKIIDETIVSLKNMLDEIREGIRQYHPYTQLAFLNPMKHMIVEALQDATNPDNDFLNNHDPKDSIVI